MKRKEMKIIDDKVSLIIKAHEFNIRRLIDEFGQDNPEDIKGLYNHHKNLLESNAKIYDFIPIFTDKKVREIISIKYQN